VASSSAFFLANSRPRHIWEDNIRMDLRERGWDGVDRIHLAHDRDKWQAL
jgi:hypothetical protein